MKTSNPLGVAAEKITAAIARLEALKARVARVLSRPSR